MIFNSQTKGCLVATAATLVFVAVLLSLQIVPMCYMPKLDDLTKLDSVKDSGWKYCRELTDAGEKLSRYGYASGILAMLIGVAGTFFGAVFGIKLEQPQTDPLTAVAFIKQYKGAILLILGAFCILLGQTFIGRADDGAMLAANSYRAITQLDNDAARLKGCLEARAVWEEERKKYDAFKQFNDVLKNLQNPSASPSLAPAASPTASPTPAPAVAPTGSPPSN